MRQIARHYIIYAPEFQETSGGISALYMLAKRVSGLGYDVKIWPYEKPVRLWDRAFLWACARRFLTLRWKKLFYMLTWFKTQTPPFGLVYATTEDLNDAIVLYSETISGNPLRAKHIVRWLLYRPGAFHKKWIAFEKDDLFFHYEASYVTDMVPAPSTQLRLGLMFRHYYTDAPNIEDRAGTVYILRKGRKRPDIELPKDAIILDGKSHREMAMHFQKARYVISYDVHTAYLSYAALLGCIPVVVPLPNLSRSTWMKQSRQFFGVAYGFDDIDHAIATQDRLHQEHLDEVATEKREILRFIRQTQAHFAGPENSGGSP